MSARPQEFDGHPASFREAWDDWGCYRGRCKRVVDGDTYDVLIDKGLRKYDYERLRLADVDTPEVFGVKHDSEEFARGQEASRFVRSLILGRAVLVRTLEEETFGRWVADVLWWDDEDGTWRSVAESLIAAGHA